MEALRLAIILTIVVVCVLAATRPASDRRGVRRAAGRERGRRGGESAPRHRFRFDRGIAVQRNRWDRPDLERAIGRDYDDVDAAFTAWPTS